MNEQIFYSEIAKQHAIEDFISNESVWIDDEMVVEEE